VPARKAHPALLVEQSTLDALAVSLGAAGFETRWDDSIEDVRRFYTCDLWGNRLELLSAGA
jgi:hypothetical protein